MEGQKKEPIYEGDYSFNTGTLKQMGALDYFFFVSVLTISASIGFYHAWTDRHEISVKEFLLAGRRMTAFPVGMSLFASFISAITLLGTPTEIYSYTTMYLWIGFSYIMVSAACAHLYVPIFYKLNVTSVYEYLEMRFGILARTCVSCIFVVHMTLYMPIVLYAPSLALNAVTGFSLWGAIISVGIVCTIYTACGGLKAVLWTDCFQVVIVMTAMTAVLIKGMAVIGVQEAYDSGLRTNRIYFSDVSLDPRVRHTVWNVIFGAYFMWAALYAVNQNQIQRCISCKSLKHAQIAMWCNGPALAVIAYLCSFIGMFIGAFYEHCDPLSTKLIKKSDQLLPIFVMDVLADIKGLPGLFVAGLFSGALSTISSGLNSISAVILEDVIRRFIAPDMREASARKISQSISLVMGVMCLLLTWMASQFDSILQGALALHGMIGGPIMGIFSLGMFCPWTNQHGALAGLLVSLVLNFWMGIGAMIYKPPHEKAIVSTANCNWDVFDNDTVRDIFNSTKPVPDPARPPFYDLYSVSYMWVPVVGFVVCVIVGLLVSFITGPSKGIDIDPSLMCPIFDHVVPFCYLPERIRLPLRFGVDYNPKTDHRPHKAISTEEKHIAWGQELIAKSEGEIRKSEEDNEENDLVKTSSSTEL